MHSFHGKNGTNFFFHGVFSDIRILKPGSEEEIEIDPSDLMEFARLAVGSEVVSLIEDHFC